MKKQNVYKWIKHVYVCVCVYIYVCIYHIYLIGEPGGLQSTESQRVGHDWATSLTSLLMRSSLVAQTVKRLSTARETWVRSLGRKDPLEKETATHSSNLAWKIPWTEEPGRLQSMGSLRIGHDWATSLQWFVFSCLSGRACPVTQSWPALFVPMDYSSPCSSGHGISQARILEWVAIFSSRDLPDPWIKPVSCGLLHWRSDSLPLHHLGSPVTSYSYLIRHSTHNINSTKSFRVCITSENI